MHLSPQKSGVAFALAGALFVAVSIPLCKLFLADASPVMTAGLLNIGAGIGVGLIWLCTCRTTFVKNERRLEKTDVRWMVGICITEILAAVSMVAGLAMTSAANASLLQNFETVITAVIALILFKELIRFRLWIGIVLITVGSFLLTIHDPASFTFSPGSLLVLLACALWGLENNFTKKVADKNPFQTVCCKSMIAGIATLILGFAIGEQFPAMETIVPILIVGLLGYGMNVLFLVLSERHLGAAKACTIYGINPFLAAILSCLIFAELPSGLFIMAAVLMILGFYFASTAARKKKTGERTGEYLR
ncbi:MAG TPA: DMT family transporter [Methanocorpusculum sp.]|nr:DMT family transporter [Methanocorpusculum sp.]